jgi:transposase
MTSEINMKAKQPRSAYTREFKAEALSLFDSGVGLAVAARRLGIASQTLHGWIKRRQQGKVVGATAPTLSADQLEIRRLKAALAQATMERDILKKATAYFASVAR